MAVQITALFMFVRAAVKDFTDDTSDFQYSWKCPRNSTECSDESDLDWQGWALFVILMAAHVLKDIINGLKLLILSGKLRHDRRSRMQYFIGGFFLTWIPLFAVYASTVYNIAIARYHKFSMLLCMCCVQQVDNDMFLFLTLTSFVNA